MSHSGLETHQEGHACTKEMRPNVTADYCADIYKCAVCIVRCRFRCIWLQSGQARRPDTDPSRIVAGGKVHCEARGLVAVLVCVCALHIHHFALVLVLSQPPDDLSAAKARG